jgi:hypothetical protein
MTHSCSPVYTAALHTCGQITQLSSRQLVKTQSWALDSWSKYKAALQTAGQGTQLSSRELVKTHSFASVKKQLLSVPQNTQLIKIHSSSVHSWSPYQWSKYTAKLQVAGQDTQLRSIVNSFSPCSCSKYTAALQAACQDAKLRSRQLVKIQSCSSGS